jgi:hypothetical protein
LRILVGIGRSGVIRGRPVLIAPLSSFMVPSYDPYMGKLHGY